MSERYKKISFICGLAGLSIAVGSAAYNLEKLSNQSTKIKDAELILENLSHASAGDFHSEELLKDYDQTVRQFEKTLLDSSIRTGLEERTARKKYIFISAGLGAISLLGLVCGAKSY